LRSSQGLTVTDDGAGLRPGFNEGVGLANTRQRLRRLYDDRQDFELTNNGNSGVSVSVRLPFRLVAPELATSHETAHGDHRRRTLALRRIRQLLSTDPWPEAGDGASAVSTLECALNNAKDFGDPDAVRETEKLLTDVR
jgi:hypothetical protein